MRSIKEARRLAEMERKVSRSSYPERVYRPTQKRKRLSQTKLKRTPGVLLHTQILCNTGTRSSTCIHTYDAMGVA